MFGKKNWFFPDAELPPPGEGQLLAHESIIVLNPNDTAARIRIRLYFTEGTERREFEAVVAANSVRCLRTNEQSDMGGIEIPLDTQYAISLHSDTPIIAQYGRLDNRQSNLAYYTTPGFSQ